MSNEKKVGTLSVDVDLDLSTMKRALKNLLAAVEATEKGLDVTPDFAGNRPPTFGVNINGKLYDVNDVEAIKDAINNGSL